MEYVRFPWLPLEAALSILNVKRFKENQFLENELINKGDCHQYRITSFIKMSILKISVAINTEIQAL